MRSAAAVVWDEEGGGGVVGGVVGDGVGEGVAGGEAGGGGACDGDYGFVEWVGVLA